MIYKIIMEFKNLQKLIDALLEDFYVLFSNNCLYVCSKTLDKVSEQTIKNILNTDNVFLTTINEVNLKNESNYVKDWCESYFIQKDIKDFEKNEQELLKEYMKCLDNCEKELKEIIKRGG